MHLAGDVLAASLRVAHGVDCQQRRLGLHVMHVLRIVDAGIAHRRLDRRRDLLDHRRPSDILGLELRAHRGADRQPQLRGWAGLGVPGKYGGMRRDDAVATTGPDHRNARDFGFASLAAFQQHAAERLVRQYPGEVVDPTVAFGLADDRDHLVGSEFAGGDAILQAGSVLHGLELDLRDFNRHFVVPYPSSMLPCACAARTRRAASAHNPRRDRSWAKKPYAAPSSPRAAAS